MTSTPSIGEEGFPIHRVWTQTEGLPNSSVERLCQTRDGWIWVATRGGLARFDGVRFTVYDRRTPNFGDDAILCLQEDAAGDLWIGTKKALYRCRRDRFERFTSKNGLADNQVNDLFAGSDGKLWIATQNGICLFKEGVFSAIPFEESFVEINDLMHTAHVASIAADENGSPVVGCMNGVRRLDMATKNYSNIWEAYQARHLVTTGPVTALLLEAGGALWAANNDVLARVVGPQRKEWALPTEGGDTRPRRIIRGTSGQIWIVRGGQLLEVTGEELKPWADSYHLQDEFITDVLPGRDGTMWLATRFGGLHQVSPTPVRVYTSKDGLSNNKVESVARRNAGGVWVATARGVMSFDGAGFRFEPSGVSLRELVGRAVYEDRAGDLWVAHHVEAQGNLLWGLTWLQPSPSGYQQLITELAVSEPSTFAEDDQGRLWVAGRNNITCLLPGSKPGTRPERNGKRLDRFHFHDNSVAFANPNGQYEIRSGKIRLHDGTLMGPEVQWPAGEPNPFEIAPLPPEQSLSSYDIRAIELGKDGSLWFGTWGGGLNCVKSRRLVKFRGEDGLPDDRVQCLFEDRNRDLWVGTRRGLAVLLRNYAGEPTHFFGYGQQCGLPNEDIRQILDDSQGFLWVGCGAGVFRVARSDLKALREGSLNFLTPLLLDKSDGLIAGETSTGSQPSACKTEDGRLWFATPHGLAVIDPRVAHGPESSSRLVFERIRTPEGELPVFNEGGALEGQLKAGSGRSLEIDYTVLNFSSPGRQRFRYKLDGNDTEWVDAGFRRSAFYTNIRPGRHRFELQASELEGQWRAARSAALVFAIAPFYWETLWFRIAVVAAAGLTAAAAIRWRINEAQRIVRLEAVAALQRERERIARDLHDDLGSQLAQISLLGDAAATDVDRSPTLARLARDAAASLDALVWTVQPQADSIPHLAGYLRQFVFEFAELAGLELTLDFHENLPDWPLSPSVRQAILLSVKEALRNVLQHAGATRVWVVLKMVENSLSVVVEDNGRGADVALPVSNGNGLVNIRRRMEEAQGHCRFESRPGAGFRVVLEAPASTHFA